MANKRSAWLTGCGIGCGIVVLVGILFVVGSFVFVRGTMHGFDAALETRAALDERFGAPDAFAPAASGAIPAERIQTFLRARELAAPARDRMRLALEPINISEERARELEEGSFWNKLRFVGGTTKNVLGLPAAMGDLFQARNEALLDSGMGMGEYTYIYVLSYASWLRLSPADEAERPHVVIEGDDAEAALPERGRSVRRLPRRVQRDVIDMLRHQLGAVDRAQGAALPEGWRDRLAAEIAAMQDDPFRVPWQDGLPKPIAASLEPFRAALEASYDPASDEFELARPRKEGMSIRTE
jgi:hypothetical protein